MTDMRVGLCGVGTVGSGLVNLFNENAEIIAQRLGSTLQLTMVGCRRDSTKCDLSPFRVTRNIMDVATDPDVDIVVELIGGTNTAFELIKTALGNRKHVVTANKALIAEHGEELANLAESNNCMLKFEAAVGGGIPIIETLCNSLSGNKIQQITGIINGTSNFILSSMSKDKINFQQALTIAQELGYAEADPTFDIEGIDAAHKLTIAASLAFGVPLDYYNVSIEGITKIEPQDITYAAKLGYTIKHIGLAKIKQVGEKHVYQMSVHPALIPTDQLLAQIDGATNAVLVDSTPLERSMYVGQGAGAGPTSSAVMADVINIARVGNSAQTYSPLAFQPGMRARIEPMSHEDIKTTNFLRIYAIDKPGVLAKITKIFSDENNSIEAIWQEEVDHSISNKGEVVPIIMLTKKIAEYKMRRIITTLEELEEVQHKINRIRVEYLDPPKPEA